MESSNTQKPKLPPKFQATLPPCVTNPLLLSPASLQPINSQRVATFTFLPTSHWIYFTLGWWLTFQGGGIVKNISSCLHLALIQKSLLAPYPSRFANLWLWLRKRVLNSFPSHCKNFCCAATT